jgi:hypothetical protein
VAIGQQGHGHHAGGCFGAVGGVGAHDGYLSKCGGWPVHRLCPARLAVNVGLSSLLKKQNKKNIHFVKTDLNRGF